MIETKKTKELKQKIRELERELTNEKDMGRQRENFIQAINSHTDEVKQTRDLLKKQCEDFERRTALAETKLSRIRNAILINENNEAKAYIEIQNIVFGKNGKHAK